MVVVGDTRTVEAALDGEQPVMIWLSVNGETPPTDVRKALEAVTTKYAGKLTVFSVDGGANPELKERFGVNKRSLLLGIYNHEVVSRRQRPWATDVEGIAESLVNLLPKDENEEEEGTEEETTVDNSVPVHVTDQSFEDTVLKSDLPVLVDFWAEWCGPCKMIAPTLEKLAKEYAGKVRIAKVDVDNNPGLAQVFRIMSIPTLMFVKEGKIVGQQAGALPEPVLRDAIEQLIALEIPAEPAN